MKNSQKLTDYELIALRGKYNLADGHARYDLNKSYNKIIEILSSSDSYSLGQIDVEKEFSIAFFQLANQKTSSWTDRILYCPSASESIEIVANFLRLQNLSTSLVEPVFDNLADILKRHRVLKGILHNSKFNEDGVLHSLNGTNTDAHFFVFPNNPTGYLIDKDAFTKLIQYCLQHNKLLILDFSFRFLCRNLILWDQYDLLENSGVRYIAIEDTGKTWPTFELKASQIISDKVTFPLLRKIYSDIFINLSPLILYILTEYINENNLNGLSHIWGIIDRNRALLRDVTRNSKLLPRNQPNGSVDWLEIMTDISDVELVSQFRNSGLHILPGYPFFWSKTLDNSKFVRISLMRNFDYFSQAVEILKKTMSSI